MRSAISVSDLSNDVTHGQGASSRGLLQTLSLDSLGTQHTSMGSSASSSPTELGERAAEQKHGTYNLGKISLFAPGSPPVDAPRPPAGSLVSPLVQRRSLSESGTEEPIAMYMKESFSYKQRQSYQQALNRMPDRSVAGQPKKCWLI